MRSLLQKTPSWRWRSFFFVVFLVYFSLGMLVPYVHDDWGWGSAPGLALLRTGFWGYNGRYVSNVLILLLTRIRLLRALTYGISFCAIVFFAKKLLGKHKKGTAILLFSALLLCLPRMIMGEAVAWTSGFINYVASVPIFLSLIFVVQKRMFEQTEPVKASRILLLSLLCLAGQCFLEQVTVYVVCLMLFAVVFVCVTRRVLDPLLLGLLAAALLGALLMFSNPIYHTAFSGVQQYQRVALGSPAAMLTNVVTRFSEILCPMLVFDNVLLSLALCATAFGALSIAKPRLGLLVSGYLLAFLLFLLLRSVLPFELAKKPFGRMVEAGLSCLFFLCLLYTVFAVPALRKTGTLSLLSAFLLFAPLLVVNPIGSRNLFAPHCLLALLCAQMATVCLQKTDTPVLRRGLAIVCVLASMYYLGIFSCVWLSDLQRVAFVREQVQAGEQSLTLYQLPFASYMHESSPLTKTPRDYFKQFYRLPEDVDIVLKPSVFPHKPS